MKDSDLLNTALLEAGLDPISYSGRGMYGVNCVAFVCDNPRDELIDVVARLPEETKNQVVSLMRGSRTDNMGYDTVVYFPQVTL